MDADHVLTREGCVRLLTGGIYLGTCFLCGKSLYMAGERSLTVGWDLLCDRCNADPHARDLNEFND